MIVSVYVPTGVEVAALTRNVVPTDPFGAGVSEALSRVQVASSGQPDTLKLSALLNPFSEVTVIVDVPCDPPSATVNEDGLADIEKSGITTFSVTVVL